MLYLLEPDDSVYQFQMSVGRALVRRTIERKPLDTLRWELAPETVDSAHVLRAGLRFGLRTGRGLVVAAGYVTTLAAYGQLVDGRDQQTEIAEQLAQLPLAGAHHSAQDHAAYDKHYTALDELGTTATSRADASIQRAEANRQKLLVQPIKDELVKHWASLTGAEPSGLHAFPSS